MSRKEQIVAEAKKLFHQKGYSATSMRALAEAVGMEAASLYAHFRSKEDILSMICFEKADIFMERMEQIRKNGRDEHEMIDSLIEMHIDMALSDPAGFGVFLNEWYSLSGKNKTTFSGLRRLYEERFVEIINQGIATGKLHPSDPLLIFSFIINAVRWVYRLPKASHRKEFRSGLKNELKEMVFRGIRLSA